MNDPKPFYQSKTIWFNAIAGVFGFLAANVPAIAALVPQPAGAVIGVAVPLINIVLRSITSQPITVTTVTPPGMGS